MIRNRPNPLRLLIVDDDVDDVQITKDCFAENKMQVNIHEVHDGDMLMNYLRTESKNLPQLILLDINMPKKDGLEVLQEIKSDNDFRKIPVIIFSTSSAIQDIEKAYELGASCFVCKPKTVEEWSDKINKIGKFWIQCVRVPE